MKITKLVHSCLLIETPERVGLIDPGIMSREAIDQAGIAEHLDDLMITHEHTDHMDVDTIRAFAEIFPDLRIVAPASAAQKLDEAQVVATSEPTDEIEHFESPHKPIEPLGVTPMQLGVHYMGKLTHPGDSHEFRETKAILALPITAPWGSVVDAVNLAIRLRPKYVIPIHDWHWNDEARAGMYQTLKTIFAREGIEFLAVTNGEPVEIEV